MATVLVTGGAGFIGSHLCEALLNLGYKTVSFDNFNDFYSPEIKRKNISGVIKTAETLGADFVSLEGDIRDSSAVRAAVYDHHPAAVVHLAACAGVRPSIAEPLRYSDVNITGTMNVLQAVKEYGVKSFLFASSSSVYGNNKKVPFSETDSVDFPISPYAATKKAGELLCHTYHHLYGVNIACLRFFTVYGPRQRPDLAIYKFTQKLFEGGIIPFYGDGESLRDYTYIDDIIDGVVRALGWVKSPQQRYGIFNLGESRTVSLSQMVSMLERVTGKKAILDIQPPQQGDVERTYADISAAREVLGYNPATEFEDGLKRFVHWYKENLALQQ